MESERETGLEPATYSLEGYRSTKWATPAFNTFKWWGRMDSNHRKRKLADLQSAPFGHSGTPPNNLKEHTLFERRCKSRIFFYIDKTFSENFSIKFQHFPTESQLHMIIYW